MKKILIHLGLIVAALIVVLLITLLGLRVYTLHGKSKPLPDYKGQAVSVATSDAKKQKFKLVVIDSTFRVGQIGGIILDQQPSAGHRVKKNRKVYVTVTKHQIEQIPLGRLPDLYGQNYDRKKKALEDGYQIKTVIKGYEHDPGSPNTILKVLYNGNTIVSATSRDESAMIDVGGTLEMILSKTTGRSMNMPDLICMSYDEARFVIANHKLEAKFVGASEGFDIESGYVSIQNPGIDDTVLSGDTVSIIISQEKPAICGDQ